MDEIKKENNLIFIAEDEPNCRSLMRSSLEDYNYDVEEFTDGESLLYAVYRGNPTAIVSSWQLPKLDGLSVCGKLKLDKFTKKIPFMIVSSRCEDDDCVLALEIGADCFLPKPFNFKEFRAKVRAMIRSYEIASSKNASDGEIICRGGITLNLLTRTAVRNNKTLKLSMKEFDLLYVLMSARGKVISRDKIMRKVWNSDYIGDTRTVDVHIRYLRQKLGDINHKPVYIKTVRGFGYRFGA